MFPKKEYTFVKFIKSPRKNKKYRAVLKNKITNKITNIDFGDKRYQQYKDTTGLGLYTHLDHNDKQRRKNYRDRFNSLPRTPYSSNYFSWNFLW